MAEGPAVCIGLTLALSDVALAAAPTHGGTLRVACGNRISHLDFHTAPGYDMRTAELSGHTTMAAAWRRLVAQPA